MRTSTQRQSPASVMQKARRFFSCAYHLKFAHVKRVDGGQINRAFSFDLSKQSFNSIGFAGDPQKQSPQTPMGRPGMHFWQHVNQKLRLGSVMRSVAVNVEKTN